MRQQPQTSIDRTVRPATTRQKQSSTGVTLPSLLAMALLAVGSLAGATAAQASDDNYGFYRILDGQAVRYGGAEDQRDVTENEPLLEGDRVSVERGSRLEVVLPDFSRVRLDELTQIDFERLRVKDERADTFRLRLFEGELQVSIDQSPEEFLLELDTARVYLLDAGSYRISGGLDYARILVREGFAEILTERGSTIARAGEEVIIEGSSDPQVWVQDAGVADSLERWADDNERDSRRDNRHVDDRLSYAAADLDQDGEWIDSGGSYAWRPYQRNGWERPYQSGYWYDTPYGVNWVSQHRWGWLTSHYGSWDFDRLHGWMWYPGVAYSPAWVHWYWGSSYVGWVPSGYYYRHYGRYGYDYFGYAGRGWRGYDNWTFCQRDRFGNRRQRVYYDGVQVVQRHGGALNGGIVTTSTRGLRRDTWGDVEAGNRILLGNASRTRGGLTYRHPEDLPDAVGYVTLNAEALPTAVLDRDPALGRPNSSTVTNRGDQDARVANGLVIPRAGVVGDRREIRQGRPTSVGDRVGTTRTGVDQRTRSQSARERATVERAPQRVVLPGASVAQPRGESRPSADSQPAGDRPVRRDPTPTRTERGRADSPAAGPSTGPSTGTWRIDRREIPRSDSTQPEARPAPSREARPSADRPTRSERPSATYDRGQSRPRSSTSPSSSPAPRATPQARPRSTPQRRYDRPSSRANSSKAKPKSSGRAKSRSTSSGSSGSSSSGSSSSGSSSRSSSGSASSSRSGGGS